MSEAPYTLHVWPPKWNLQSLDPTCLAAVVYLQLTIPGKFKVAPCTNPDKSPNGQLPFLTHGHTAVSTFPSIVAFVASLAKSSHASGAIDLDASLTGQQNCLRVALFCHVEQCVSDLVSHMLYGIDMNFWGLTNPALASEMSAPQKYYVPGRIRESYRFRLEAAGLWSLPAAEEEQKGLDKDKKKKRDYRVTFSRAFEREKILDKAKTMLGVHAGHLGGKRFIFGDHPTSLDVYLAAHILLLADPPFPDAVLQVQLIEFYPGLIEHARRIQAEVARPPDEHSTATETSLAPHSSGDSRAQILADPADSEHLKKTVIFVAAALAMTAGSLCMQLVIENGAAEGSEDEGEDGEDEGDNSKGGEEEEEEELSSGSGVFTDEEEN